jgi:hypothetical protein
MRRAALLNRIPGLSAETLQYLGDRGYIKYNPIQEGKVMRRDYPESEVPYITYLSSLLQKDITPEKACRRARKKFPGH